MTKRSPRIKAKHEGAVLARIDRLLNIFKENSAYVVTLTNYKHFVGCDYLNDNGLHHVEMMVGLMEKGT